MHYFDTSFVAPLFLPEDKSEHAKNVINSIPNERVISQWLRVEFASLIARYIRMKNINKDQASQIMENFEMVVNDSFDTIVPSVSDFNLAVSLLQHPNTGLRGGDALHLAMAQNHGAKKFYTFDLGLQKAAKQLTSLTVIS